MHCVRSNFRNILIYREGRVTYLMLCPVMEEGSGGSYAHLRTELWGQALNRTANRAHTPVAHTILSKAQNIYNSYMLL